MTSTSDFTLDVPGILAKYDPLRHLDLYYTALMDENSGVNLVSRETSRGDFDRMVAESLLPFDVIGAKFSDFLDIGSGGGIPAIPIILTQSLSGRTTLIERTLKKAAALERIIQRLNIQAKVVSKTFEEFRSNQKFGLITLRYVKLDAPLLGRIMSFLIDDGVFVYYSAPSFEISTFSLRVYSFTVPKDGAVKQFTVFHRK